MAVPYEQEERDEEQEAGQPRQLGPESAVIQSQEKPQAGAGEGSGQYTNLQSYLDANASLRQGEKLAGRVGETVAGAEKAQGEANVGFREGVNQGSVAGNEQLLQSIGQNPVALSQQQRDEFKKIRDARYQGPQDFASDTGNYSKAYGATNKASQEAKASESEGGRFALLGQYYDRPDYTKGQRKLDQLLVQNDPASRAAFEGVRAQADEKEKNFANLQNTLNQYAQTQRASTDTARKGARDFIGVNEHGQESGAGELYKGKTGVQGKLSAAQTAKTTGEGALKGQLSARDISAENAGKYGLNEGMKTWTVDPSQYFKGGMDPTLANVASQDDVARMNALYDLSGLQNNFLTDPSQAGTYDPNQAYGFNTDQFMNDIRGAESKYNTALDQGVFGSIANTTGFYGGGGHQGRSVDELSQLYNLTPEEGQQLRGNIGDWLSSPMATESGEGNSLREQMAEVNRRQAAWDKMASEGPVIDTRGRDTFTAQAAQLRALQDLINQKYGYGNTLR